MSSLVQAIMTNMQGLLWLSPLLLFFACCEQECLTPETTIELLEACKAGKQPPLTKWGRYGVVACCCLTSPNNAHRCSLIVVLPWLLPFPSCFVSLPMNGQDSCEGPQGQTTLKGEIPGPRCRELPTENLVRSAPC